MRVPHGHIPANALGNHGPEQNDGRQTSSEHGEITAERACGPGCEEGRGKPGSGPPGDRRWPACRGGGEGDSLLSSGLCAWDLTGLPSDGRRQVRESRSQTPTRVVSRPEDAPCRWGRNQDVCPGRHERGPLCDICVRRDQGLRPSRGTCKSLLKEHGV